MTDKHPPALPLGHAFDSSTRDNKCAHVLGVYGFVKDYCRRSPAEHEQRPRCAICGKPAACLGAYEGAEMEEYACSKCCGHGNEDGYCKPVAPDPPKEEPPRCDDCDPSFGCFNGTRSCERKPDPTSLKAEARDMAGWTRGLYHRTLGARVPAGWEAFEDALYNLILPILQREQEAKADAEQVRRWAEGLITRAEKAERELAEAMETRDFFANRLNEALGALGYPVPGDTPEGRYRCGMCGPKDAALIDADHEWALWREKWASTLDTYSSLLESERAKLAEAEARIAELERDLTHAAW